ncbi:uncharacterized protein BT62DRAFT_1077863 [Guyanagaster necrorhizus]|uniref:Uncharacterized protein n=1 Tax=Guyanagaster necrorhizus TaxID=856835 RepID=A0A9P8AS60_9AGAR|nr:uncharacterized protein BT62DRAFT_1077863 [Guyanagaster necrorhizus MCA 3950]KAG7444547.1 hypothetical protein BT62DRAFT_1077863 [Guyanagaster necrorhizus MCA 3950]
MRLHICVCVIQKRNNGPFVRQGDHSPYLRRITRLGDETINIWCQHGSRGLILWRITRGPRGQVHDLRGNINRRSSSLLISSILAKYGYLFIAEDRFFGRLTGGTVNDELI